MFIVIVAPVVRPRLRQLGRPIVAVATGADDGSEDGHRRQSPALSPSPPLFAGRCGGKDRRSSSSFAPIVRRRPLLQGRLIVVVIVVAPSSLPADKAARTSASRRCCRRPQHRSPPSADWPSKRGRDFRPEEVPEGAGGGSDLVLESLRPQLQRHFAAPSSSLSSLPSSAAALSSSPAALSSSSANVIKLAMISFGSQMGPLLGEIVSEASIGIGGGGSGNFNLLSNGGVNNNCGSMMGGMGLTVMEPLGIVLQFFLLNVCDLCLFGCMKSRLLILPYLVVFCRDCSWLSQLGSRLALGSLGSRLAWLLARLGLDRYGSARL
jgi:hypothetical protein